MEWKRTSEIYRHYKGGLYTILFCCQNATNAADRDEMVVYVSHQNGQIYCREALEFFGNIGVDDNNQFVKRFTLVKNA